MHILVALRNYYKCSTLANWDIWTYKIVRKSNRCLALIAKWVSWNVLHPLIRRPKDIWIHSKMRWVMDNWIPLNWFNLLVKSSNCQCVAKDVNGMNRKLKEAGFLGYVCNSVSGCIRLDLPNHSRKFDFPKNFNIKIAAPPSTVGVQ